MKTVTWERMYPGWYPTFYSKVHAFEPFDDPYVSSQEITLCGRVFSARTDRDRLRAAATGHVNYGQPIYLCEIGRDLKEVECKTCLKKMAECAS